MHASRFGAARSAALAVTVALAATASAMANHIPGQPCNNCASHKLWPRITGKVEKAHFDSTTFVGTARSDELLGHHGSDHLYGKGGSDILWGDWEGGDSQPKKQHDTIYGGPGNDFIYASHGHNRIYGGPGNDAISAHFGRGVVDCGAGNDIYHVATFRKHKYRFVNCEKVDYRSEAQRGGGLKPLP